MILWLKGYNSCLFLCSSSQSLLSFPSPFDHPIPVTPVRGGFISVILFPSPNEVYLFSLVHCSTPTLCDYMDYSLVIIYLTVNIHIKNKYIVRFVFLDLWYLTQYVFSPSSIYLPPNFLMLFNDWSYYIMQMYHILFTHSSAEVHLGSFPFLVIIE